MTRQWILSRIRVGACKVALPYRRVQVDQRSDTPVASTTPSGPDGNTKQYKWFAQQIAVRS
jgi:hypothetical protein